MHDTAFIQLLCANYLPSIVQACCSAAAAAAAKNFSSCLQCCRWVYKKLLGEAASPQKSELADLLLIGQREVDGGSVHYRDLMFANEDTDLSKGFR